MTSLTSLLDIPISLAIALTFGALGAALTLASNLMRRMVPLRVLAMIANAMFLVEMTIDRNWILFGLQASLFCINAWRLWSIWRTMKQLNELRAADAVREWLLPYMKRRTFKAGTVLFREGDPADQIYYINQGHVSSPQFAGAGYGPGEMFGEISLFTQAHTRKATVVCDTYCVMHTMTSEALSTLYLQNPGIGIYMIRLVVQHLLSEIERRTAPAVVAA
jgi:CRP/FNR family cyclic AMP-dependent transcriptional regulator